MQDKDQNEISNDKIKLKSTLVHSYFNVYGFFLLDFSMHSILCAMSAFLMFLQSEDLLRENIHTETMPYSLDTHTHTTSQTGLFLPKKEKLLRL